MGMLPIFETNRLLLKAVTLEDEPAYTRHFVNYEVIRHLSDKVPWPYPEHGVRDYLTDVILPHQARTNGSGASFSRTHRTKSSAA